MKSSKGMMVKLKALLKDNFKEDPMLVPVIISLMLQLTSRAMINVDDE